MSEFLPVGEAASFPPGYGRTVHVAGREFAVYNLDGQFYAIDDQCPHRGGPLGAGLLDKGEVVCPLHGWSFDLKTGACLSGADRAVKTYPVRIVDGEVQICISPDPAAR
jgi:nitrite reductase (NADH) small subunit